MAIPTAPVRLTLPEARPRYDAENEQETRRLIELALQRLPSTGGGALPERRTVEFTTASLGAGAEEQGEVDVGAPGVALRTIAADRACRVRLYAVAASQAADALRAHTTPPPAGTGVFLDAIWLTAHEKIIAPPVVLFNADSPPDSVIYYIVENLSGSTGAVTVTMTVVSVEA